MTKTIALLGVLALGVPLAWSLVPEHPASAPAAAADSARPARPARPVPTVTDEATFAGGCFWSIEKLFDNMEGVVSATSGFMGGEVKNPSYHQVTGGATGHRESVHVVYDPARVSYEQLLNAFWHDIDPTSPDGQFCDFGPQYRTAVFYHNERQHQAALASKRQLDASGVLDKPIVTEILPAGAFYPAEEYHQDFARKNPARYNAYRIGCGRDRKLQEVWGDQAWHTD